MSKLSMPELQRQLWLTLTPHRLIATPIVLASLFYLAYLINGMASLHQTAFYVFIFFSYLWGTRCASASLCDEINDKTWDWQRMSQQGPLSLGLGKLLGATAFTWFGAAIAYCVYLSTGVQMQVAAFGYKAFILLLGALWFHILALLFSLEALNHRHSDKLSSFRYFAGAVFVGWFSISWIYTQVTAATHTQLWHNFSLTSRPFYLLSLAVFMVWGVIGLYRNFRKELQYQNIPWIWALFTLFAMIYFSGFIGTAQSNQMTLNVLNHAEHFLEDGPYYAAFFIAVFLTYLSFLTEDLGFLRYQKIKTAFSHKHFKAALEKAPKWPFSALLCLMAAAFLIVQSSISIPLQHATLKFSPAVFTSSVLLYMVRDILLVHLFQFKCHGKQTKLTALFYLAILYILVPSLLNMLHLDTLSASFVPGMTQFPIAALLGPIVQILILGGWVYHRWHQSMQALLE